MISLTDNLKKITRLIEAAKRCRAICLLLIRSGFIKYTSENARQPSSIVRCLSVALVTNLSKRGRIRASTARMMSVRARLRSCFAAVVCTTSSACMISITFSNRVVLDASREINCYLMFGGCEIVAQEEEDPRSRVEGGWAPAGRDAREHGSVGGAALGCRVPRQEEEEVRI